MGNLMRIAELEGQVERKDAYIDKLELKLDEVKKDRDQRAELSARLFAENEQLKHQVNLKQLEIDHCHAVCAELRQKLDVVSDERNAFATEVDEANDTISHLRQQLELAASAMGLAKAGE